MTPEQMQEHFENTYRFIEQYRESIEVLYPN